MSINIKAHKLSVINRILLAIGTLAMIAVYFVPLWQIQLWAPQYPEGLIMYIWHNNIDGDVNTINGLNHYIGMKLIKVEMFPEFKILGILIAIYIAWGLLVSITGSYKLLVSYIIGDIVFVIAAMADFFRWGYDYGHNLDSHAAIQVPGMSYQPPVIGYKVLLNFEAYSGPYIGGWIVVGAGAIAVLILFFEWMKRKKHKSKLPHVFSLVGIFMLVSFSSCSQVVEPIKIGVDNCNFCQMTIMKNTNGSEIITNKGKIYKFDDHGCMRDFIADKKVSVNDISKIYFNEYESGILMESTLITLVKNEAFRTPMNWNIIAVKNENANKYLLKKGSSIVDIKEWLK